MCRNILRRELVSKVLAGLVLLGMTSSSVCGQTLLWEHVGTTDQGTTLGERVWPLEDVNGDGVTDILTTVPFASNGPLLTTGWVGVLSGADGSTIYEAWGPVGQALRASGAVGDIDGDGAGDYATSMPTFGAEIVSGATGQTLLPLPNYTAFLQSLWPLGDLNGDGNDEFIGPGFYGPGTPQVAFAGAVTVYSGPNGIPLFSAFGSSSLDFFGSAVAPCGDIDGDLTPDFIVGAPGPPSEFGGQIGSAYVCSGVDGSYIHQWTGTAQFGRFGSSVAGIGDIDQDGVPDLAVGATGSWQTFLYSGGTGALIATFSTPALFQLPPTRGLGDLDQDGVADFTIANGCQATVYSGAALTVLQNFVTLGSGASPPCIYDIVSPGDLNSDGYPDLILGVPNNIAGAPPGRIQAFSLLPAGVSPFGNACEFASGVLPRIGITGSPVVGQAFTINLTGPPANTFALLMLGFSNTQWAGTPLPLDLGTLGLPGCELLISPDGLVQTLTQSVGPMAASTSFGVAIPGSPLYAGATLYAQFAVTNPPGSPTLLGLSEALEIVVQP